MAILTRSGRAALAAAVKAQALHIALGEGNPDWDTPKAGTFTFSDQDRIDLPHAPVSGVSVKIGATTYAAGSDYTADGLTGRIARLPAGAIPAGAGVNVAYTRLHPVENPNASGLLAEVGRRIVDEVEFVRPDAAGAIVVPTGRYAVSATPTNHLFVRVRFDFTDASTATIREQALIMGTVTDPTLPPGQQFFLPADLDDPGILLMLQHSVPIVRQPSTRETFEFVVTF